MSESPLLPRFREIVDFVNVQLASGAAFDEKWKRSIFTLIQESPPMTIQTGNVIMNMFSTSFSPSDKADFAARTNDKVDLMLANDVPVQCASASGAARSASEQTPAAGAAAPGVPGGAQPAPAGAPAAVAQQSDYPQHQVARRPFQENMWFQKYLTPELWKAFVDPAVAWADVLPLIGERMAQIGLLWPSEHTCLHIWVVFICARVPAGNPQHEDGPLAIERRMQLASEAQLQRQRAQVCMNEFPWVQQYPNCIDAFKAAYPQSYARAYPEGFVPFTCTLDDRLPRKKRPIQILVSFCFRWSLRAQRALSGAQRAFRPECNLGAKSKPGFGKDEFDFSRGWSRVSSMACRAAPRTLQ